MSQNSIFNDKLTRDLLAARVVKYWWVTELILTLASVILIFFLPKSAQAFFWFTFFAILISIGVGTFLFIKYSSLADVKNKRMYVSEKSKLVNKITKINGELANVDQALASNQVSDTQDIEGNLQRLEVEYIENGMKAARLEGGNIPGVGPKLKEKLKVNHIVSAADIGSYRRFRVLSPDPHNFDGDGIGCES